MEGKVKSYLRADEQLIWTGRPHGGVRFSGSDIFVIPFSLFWGGGVASVFLAGGGQIVDQGFPWVVFPLLFLAIAVYITVGRFIHDAWLRSRTEYALTDRRVLVLKRIFSDDLTALDLSLIEIVRLKGGRDQGRGDILFGQEPNWFGFGRQSFRASFALWTPSLSATPALLGIANARQLFDQIEALRARDGSRPLAM